MHGESYSKEEDKFLRLNYVALGPAACAEKLGRSQNSVRLRVSRHLGCVKWRRTKRQGGGNTMQAPKPAESAANGFIGSGLDQWADDKPVVPVMAWDNQGRQVWPIPEQPKRDPLETAANWGIIALTAACLLVLLVKLAA